MATVPHSTATKVRIEIYWITVALVTLLPLASLSLPTLLMGVRFTVVHWAFTVLLAAYYLTSIMFVQTNERGGITVLEKPAREVGPGMYFVPRFLMELFTIPISTQQDQFPADPELISKRPDEFGLKENELRPIRATTAAGRIVPGDDLQNEDPLNTRLTLELTYSIRWRLREKGFFDMYVSIPGRTWDDMRTEIRRQMRDTSESELVEEVSKRTPFEVNGDIQVLNAELEREVQTGVSDWGIDILEARLQTPDFSHDVSKALSNIATNRAEAQATAAKAQGEQQRLILEGEGQAQARERLATARQAEIAAEGKGLKEAADALEMPGADYYAGEIVKTAVGEGDLIIGTDGISQIAGLGKYIFKGKNGKDNT
ncbi:MAG: hypothetical protein JWN64_309 [Parcubacteria group bacterium]|nr:hypothetical protein [Parcubacteria group bacterium]